MKNTIASISFLLCMISLASAKDYKVASADEFNKATGTVKAGDAIVIKNGIYTPWEIIVNTNGTEKQPVIIRAETSGKVIFSGDVNNPVFQLTGTYTEIAGISFTACNVFKPAGKNGVLIELKSTGHCRITDCSFTKNTVKTQFMPIVIVSGKGEYNRVDHCSFISNIDNQELQVKITVEEVPLYTLVDHNVFRDKDRVSWENNNGGECVQVGQDPILRGTLYSYALVRDNKFVHCNGEPEVISNKSSGNKYISILLKTARANW